MSHKQSHRDEFVEWARTYADDVTSTFGTQFKAAGNRFRDSICLMNRFTEAVNNVLSNDGAKFRAVDEAHNELCIASALLSNPNPRFDSIEYEPPLTSGKKTIDFRATTKDNQTVYIDVKTINPEAKDRWDQYERAQKEGWFPKNAHVMLDQQWLGGELWHNKFAARSRMLEYAVELERKIKECKLATTNIMFVLALCGEGFVWHQDELEDFVWFYYTKSHRFDDPFSKAEIKDIEINKITLTRAISRFACMSRPQGEIQHKRLNWHVRPPRDPIFN
jgi:hypothetical protein